jgi:dCTP deaminase
MILSDKTIKDNIEKGIISIDPFFEENVQPASIDMTLGTHFLEVDTRNTERLKLDEEIIYREINSEDIVIPAHSFLLATTEEYIKLSNGLTAFVEGRSSIGRMGLFIQNAGWVDAGFEGKITLELYNANSLPIKLVAGRRICQLVFCKMDQDAENPYKGKYLGQSKSIGSRAFQDKEILKSIQ